METLTLTITLTITITITITLTITLTVIKTETETISSYSPYPPLILAGELTLTGHLTLSLEADRHEVSL